MAKSKQQKPNFDIGDLLGFLNNPKVKAATNLSQGKLTGQDVMGVMGGGQSAAAPYSGQVADAYNAKAKQDFETAKFLADFYTPASETQRLVQGKSEPLDALWVAMNFFPYAKAGKKLKNIDKTTKMMLDALRASKPLRSHSAGMHSGSTDTQYSPFELLLMGLAGE